MTKKDTKETKDQKVIIQQHNRTMQFSQAVEKNTSLFKSTIIFLALVVALAAFLALVCGDAYWAKSFPHKDDRLIEMFVCLSLAVVAFAIIAVASGKSYLVMVDKISAETRGMYKAWVLDSTDFRHNIEAKVTTFIQYAAKELTGLFVTLASIGIIASFVAASFGIIQTYDKAPNNNNLAAFVLIHVIIIVGINVAVILSTTIPVVKEATDLTMTNLESSKLLGSINHTWEFDTTFADRWALLQMPPKEVKANGTKDNA